MAKYVIIGGCVAPKKLAPVLAEIQQETGCSYASIYRGEDAAALLHTLGKHTQAEIYYEFTHGEEPNPANPPGRSTHECRSDGVPYPAPIGRNLAYWQCGIDVDDAHVEAFIAAAAKHGWSAFRPYSSGSEYHHVNFRKLPVFFSPDFKKGSKGPMVLLFTQRLAKLGYLTRRWWHFDANVSAAVMRFQKGHHLTVDGQVGPATWAAIKMWAAKKR